MIPLLIRMKLPCERQKYKLCSLRDRNQNGLGVSMNARALKNVVVCKKNDRIVRVRITNGIEILNIVSAYAPHVEIEELIKKEILEGSRCKVQNTQMNEKLYIKSDLNANIWECRYGSENVDVSFGYGARNAEEEPTLDLAPSYDLLVHNK